MRRSLLVLLALLALLAVTGLTGCKSKEQKACGKMMEFMEEAIAQLPEEARAQAAEGEGMTEEVCLAHIERQRAECSNMDAFLDCVIGADSMDVAEDCDSHCRAAEGSN